MAKRIGGSRRKTRSIITKHIRRRGKISISQYFQTFEPGDKAALKMEPAVHKGQYFRRFHGKVATVIGKRGNAYELKVNDQGKEKMVIVHPVHLKRL